MQLLNHKENLHNKIFTAIKIDLKFVVECIGERNGDDFLAHSIHIFVCVYVCVCRAHACAHVLKESKVLLKYLYIILHYLPL